MAPFFVQFLPNSVLSFPKTVLSFPFSVWAFPFSFWSMQKVVWSLQTFVWSVQRTKWSFPIFVWSLPKTKWSFPTSGAPKQALKCSPGRDIFLFDNQFRFQYNGISKKTKSGWKYFVWYEKSITWIFTRLTRPPVGIKNNSLQEVITDISLLHIKPNAHDNNLFPPGQVFFIIFHLSDLV